MRHVAWSIAVIVTAFPAAAQSASPGGSCALHPTVLAEVGQLFVGGGLTTRAAFIPLCRGKLEVGIEGGTIRRTSTLVGYYSDPQYGATTLTVNDSLHATFGGLFAAREVGHSHFQLRALAGVGVYNMRQFSSKVAYLRDGTASPGFNNFVSGWKALLGGMSLGLNGTLAMSSHFGLTLGGRTHWVGRNRAFGLTVGLGARP